MTAALELFKDQLDVYLPGGARRNVYFISDAAEGEGGLHSLDGKQLVRRLCRRYAVGGTVVLVVAAGYRKNLAVDNDVRFEFCLGYEIVKARLEQRLRFGGICALAAQIQSRTEGLYSGIARELLRIKKNTGIHDVRLFAQKRSGGNRLLKYFRNKLARRRRRRLYIGYKRCLVEFRGLSVVVYIYGAPGHLGNSRSLKLHFAVDVNNDGQRVAPDKLLCIGGAYEHRAAAVLIDAADTVVAFFEVGVLEIADYIESDPAERGKPCDAYAGAYAVEIRGAVSHDKDV